MLPVRDMVVGQAGVDVLVGQVVAFSVRGLFLCSAVVLSWVHLVSIATLGNVCWLLGCHVRAQHRQASASRLMGLALPVHRCRLSLPSFNAIAAGGFSCVFQLVPA